MRRLVALTLAAVVALPPVAVPAELPYYRHSGDRVAPYTALDYLGVPGTARVSEPLALVPNVRLAKGPGAFTAPLGLPAGLQLSPATGVLTVYASVPGTIPSSRVMLVDANGLAVTASTPQVTVLPQLRLAYPGTLTGVVGARFDASPLVWDGIGGSPRVDILSGAIPAGLALDPSTGHIGGIPAAPGTSVVRFALVDASDGRQVSAGETAFVMAAAAPLALSAAAPPGASVDQAYAYTLPVSGGRAPMSYALTAGTLPAGMSLGAAGLLSGTAAQEGTYPFSVRVTDFDGRTADGSLTLTVARALVAAAPALPRGTVGTAYPASAFSVQHAVGAVAWTASGLPSGLSLSTDGVLAGGPAAAGDYPFTVTAVDSRSNAVSLSATVSFDAPLKASAPALPLGATNSAYPAQSFTASGGFGTRSWTATGLPSGLSLTSAGRLQGTPRAAGSFTVRATVRDAAGRSDAVDAPLQVSAVFAAQSATLPAGTLGRALGPVQLASAGGADPVTWSVASGSPPDGVTLSASGSVSGTPSVAGSFAFVARATDAGGQTADVPLSTTVAAAVSVDGPAALPRGTQGTAYAMDPGYPFAAGGGRTAPSLQASNLHPGLSLSNGLVVGTPTASGTRTVTITARDADGRQASLTRSLAVDPPLSVPAATMPADVAGNDMAPYGLSAAGGRPPYAWTVDASQLHVGVTASADGVLTGRPTSTGTRTYAVSVRDADGRRAAGTVQHTVDADPTHPALSGAPPASVPMGTSFDVSPFSAVGGQAPYAYAVGSGWLPPGVSLGTDGRLSGSPGYAGTWSFTVRVTDADGRTGEGGPFAMQVTGPYTISGSLPARGKVGQPYSAQFYVTAAPTSGKFFAYTRTGPSSWTGASQTVFDTVTIDRATGVVSGTPTRAGTYTGIEIWHDVGSWLGIGSFTVVIDP